MRNADQGIRRTRSSFLMHTSFSNFSFRKSIFNATIYSTKAQLWNKFTYFLFSNKKEQFKNFDLYRAVFSWVWKAIGILLGFSFFMRAWLTGSVSEISPHYSFLRKNFNVFIWEAPVYQDLSLCDQVRGNQHENRVFVRGRTFHLVVFHSMSGTLISIFEGFFLIIIICFYLSISWIY